MNRKLVTGILFSLTSLSLAYAMDMTKDMTSNDMMKKDATGTMMIKEGTTSMMHNAMQEGMVNYDSGMMTSKKEDISKLQMMLVDKGFLTMPKGVSYGYYGPRTKMAYKKYKSSMMMKSESGSAMMKATGTMMMDH
jgi:hypothetical protein